MRFSIDKDNVEAAHVLQACCLRRSPGQTLAEPRSWQVRARCAGRKNTALALAQRTYPLSTLSTGQDDAASEGAFPGREPGKGSTNGQASGSL